jgi:hypothetical protein
MESKDSEEVHKMVLSPSTIDLAAKPLRIWKPDMSRMEEDGAEDIEAVGRALILDAHEFAQTNGTMDGIDLGHCEAKYITSAVVLGLAGIGEGMEDGRGRVSFPLLSALTSSPHPKQLVFRNYAWWLGWRWAS